jgi:hypothetical protein
MQLTSINHSPRIGQNIEEIIAQAKLRFGCVCSSNSDIRRRSIQQTKNTMNFHIFIISTIFILIDLSW